MNERDIRVWTLPTVNDSLDSEAARHLLSRDEDARARAYTNLAAGHRFAITRAALRLLLGRQVGLPPQMIRIVYDPAGKPRVADCSSGVEFSVSESAGHAAIAITRGCSVGIDVEFERHLPDLEELCLRSLSASECREILTLRNEEQLPAFYACWTRKEAIAKALGLGLGLPFESFEVSTEPDKPAKLIRPPHGELLDEWSLLGFRPSPTYQGALAYRDRQRPVFIRSVTLRELLAT